MAQITDVAPDVFRITTFVEPASLQFSRCCLMPAIARRTNAGPCRSGRRWRRWRTPWATCLERRRTMRGRWRGWAGLRVLEGHARARLS
jgi:hypothetical protein